MIWQKLHMPAKIIFLIILNIVSEKSEQIQMKKLTCDLKKKSYIYFLI